MILLSTLLFILTLVPPEQTTEALLTSGDYVIWSAIASWVVLLLAVIIPLGRQQLRQREAAYRAALRGNVIGRAHELGSANHVTVKARRGSMVVEESELVR